MKQQLLLLKDVDGLGRKGEIIARAKPGFVRNFLLPYGYAVAADKHTVKLQERLKEERAKQAEIDLKESHALASKLKDLVLEQEVKVDTEGKMYGSVTHLEIAKLLQDLGHPVERKSILLPGPLKKLGEHKVPLRLKEGVEAHIKLTLIPEGGVAVNKQALSQEEVSEQQESQEHEEASA